MSLLQGNFNLGVNNTGDFNQGAATFQSLSPTVECMSQVLTMHMWRHSGMWNNGTGNAGTYNLGLNNTGNFNRGISNNGDGNQGELITLSYIYIYIHILHDWCIADIKVPLCRTIQRWAAELRQSQFWCRQHWQQEQW